MNHLTYLEKFLDSGLTLMPFDFVNTDARTSSNGNTKRMLVVFFA